MLAHLVARHGTKQMTRGEIMGLATSPLLFTRGCTDDGASIPAGFVAFRRSHEAQADQLAIEWMTRAGYSPAAWAAYLERLKPPSVLPLADRIAAMISASPPESASETGGFPEAQARALAIVPASKKPKADKP